MLFTKHAVSVVSVCHLTLAVHNNKGYPFASSDPGMVVLACNPTQDPGGWDKSKFQVSLDSRVIPCL